MALFSALWLTERGGRLAERGIRLSASQTYRLVAEAPERLSMKTLMALPDILACRMEELIEPVPAARAQRKAASADLPQTPADRAERGVGTLRPKPARVIPQ